MHRSDSLFLRTNVYNRLGASVEGVQEIQTYVWRTPVKLKLIWQPYGLLIHSTGPLPPVFSLYHTLPFPLFNSSPLIVLSPHAFLHHAISTTSLFLPPTRRISQHIVCVFVQQLIASAVSSHTCSPHWYVLMTEFYRSFMCASCVAMAGYGCSSSKSICHMSNIC